MSIPGCDTATFKTGDVPSLGDLSFNDNEIEHVKVRLQSCNRIRIPNVYRIHV